MNERNLSYKASEPPRELTQALGGNQILMTVLIAFALCAVLMIASNFVLARYSSNAGNGLIRAKWELLASQERPVDVLVLGDSSANQGIDSENIMATSDMSALNIATTASAGVLNDFLMLESYIDRVGPPTCAIVGHAYDIWRRPVDYSLVAQVPIDDELLMRRLDELAYGFGAKARFLLAKHVRAYFENTSMRELLVFPWTARDSTAFEKLRRRFDITASGYYAKRTASPKGVATDMSRHLASMRAGDFVPANENRQALRQVIELADKHEFRVYVVNSPLYSGLYDNQEFKRYLADVNRYIADMIGDSDYVTHLFAEPVTFEDDELESVDHLIASSAKDFTRTLMGQIDCSPP